MESTERLSTFISEGELSQQLEGHTSGESHLKPTETVPCWPLPGHPGACGCASILCELDIDPRKLYSLIIGYVRFVVGIGLQQPCWNT